MTRAGAGAEVGTIHATIAANGHILSADPPVMRLQIAAGGTESGRLLVPQLAAIARLSQRLRILVARPVLAAGEGTKISMWVRARPAADSVELIIQDWRESLVPVLQRSSSDLADDIAIAGEGWNWRTDARMTFAQQSDVPDLAFAQPGTAFTDYFPFREGNDDAVSAAVTQRLPFFGQEVTGVDGTRYLLSGHPVFDIQGGFAGYRGKAARVEPELAVAPAHAGEAAPEMAMMPDFGRRLDLALRQPLGRIIANADTISGQLEGPLRTDYASYAADIASAGRHLMELVDDLADLQAIDRPNFQVAREDVDLADIARRAAGLLGLKAADRAIRIEPPAADEAMPAIGEFRRALQIVVNLVGNAVRYGPEHSTVWLRVDEAAGMARLVVADQGRGIAPEDHERVFEKFERLGRDDASGSGLGLYISRRLARAMGGDITLDSAPGQGARFLLTLPRP